MPDAPYPRRWTPEFYESPPQPPPAASPDPATPYWIPAGVELADVPAELRAALADIVNPIYRELVLDAKPGLHQSTGLTIVHLLWMEIIDHLELAAPPPDVNRDPLAILRDGRSDKLARHLRLVGAKLKASELLLRLDQFKATCQKRIADAQADHEAAFARIFPGHVDPGRPDHGKSPFC